MKATNEQIEFARIKMLAAERMLEEIGKDICSLDGSMISHSHINNSISELQQSIHNLRRMRNSF